MTDNNTNLLTIEEVQDVPLSPATAISAMALNMAINWINNTVVKDGVMYQQLKLENKNIQTVDLGDVFEVAKQFEAHIVRAPERLAKIVVDAINENATDAHFEISQVDDHWTYSFRGKDVGVKFDSEEAAREGIHHDPDLLRNINVEEQRYVNLEDMKKLPLSEE